MSDATLGDAHIHHLTKEALQLYDGFEEIYRPLIIEAVMRNLPPEFDRDRVDRVVAQYVP